MYAHTARELRAALEPYHALVYFEPEPADEYEQIGLRGPRMGYFASRSAAMGPVPAEVVTATFFGFHPGIVARSIPAAWALAQPADVIEARLRGIDRTLRRRLGTALGGDDVRVAAELARALAEACTPQGRPLYAAHSTLPWPDEPHLVLWHAATLFREYRGDAHIAALVVRNIGPCESLVLDAADGRNPADFLRKVRAWHDDEWEAAHDSLAARGLVDAEGTTTPSGRKERECIEADTDRASLEPARRLGETASRQLLDAMAAVNGSMSA